MRPSEIAEYAAREAALCFYLAEDSKCGTFHEFVKAQYSAFLDVLQFVHEEKFEIRINKEQKTVGCYTKTYHYVFDTSEL